MYFIYRYLNQSVEAVIEWIKKNSRWEETLLVVTTDHDNGMPMGPDAQQNAFERVLNKGKGPEAFASRICGTDAGYARYVAMNNGEYIDNTDVFTVVKAALDGSAVSHITR